MTVVDHPANRGKSGSPAATGEPQLPDDRINQIRVRLRKHLDDNAEITQGQAAKRVGVSVATISYFLSGTYSGNVSNVARAVERYLDLHDQQRSVGAGPKFVKTSISQRIERAIFTAETTGRIAVVATQSGLGKTKTIINYLESHPRSVYIGGAPDLNSKWAMLSELCNAITKDDSRRRSPAHARREIVHSLFGTGRTIIIDESQFLVQDCIDELRCIHDQAGVALVLSGNESTYEGFRNRGGSGHSVASTSYTQFHSRVIARLHLSSADITTRDIKLLAAQMIPESVVNDSLGVLQHEAINNGGFRRIISVLQIAQMIAGTRTLTKAHVVRAIDQIKQVDGGDEC